MFSPNPYPDLIDSTFKVSEKNHDFWGFPPGMKCFCKKGGKVCIPYFKRLSFVKNIHFRILRNFCSVPFVYVYEGFSLDIKKRH
ncbi:hypothetical protein BAMY_07035 [Bacillus amyloliquefaciens]|nr:hypothetical protein BAMY_07035 [Bacillus amyloliquefaciens]